MAYLRTRASVWNVTVNRRSLIVAEMCSSAEFGAEPNSTTAYALQSCPLEHRVEPSFVYDGMNPRSMLDPSFRRHHRRGTGLPGARRRKISNGPTVRCGVRCVTAQ